MTRHDQAYRDPLVALPDDRFIFADDLTRLTLREVVKIALGSLIGLLVVWAIAFAVSLL